MSFREFVDDTLGAVEATVANARNRDLTPMVHLELSDGRREIVPVDHRFFTEPDGVSQLVERFVVPLVRQHEATKVAWTFTSVVHGMRFAFAVAMDAEVDEVWIAPIFHEGPGDWLALPPNTTYGLMVGPIQEALR